MCSGRKRLKRLRDDVNMYLHLQIEKEYKSGDQRLTHSQLYFHK